MDEETKGMLNIPTNTTVREEIKEQAAPVVGSFASPSE
jgi:hypothetical protein